MKKLLGDLLLLAGVIIAALAAGESRRVSRAASVGPDLIGEVLHTAIRTDYEGRLPDLLLAQDQELAADTELTSEHVAWLREHGIEEALVLRRKETQETLPTDAELIGRVLAEPVVLTSETEVIAQGRKISDSFVERLRASDAYGSITIKATVADEDGAPQREQIEWDLAEGARNASGATLLGSFLGQEVTLPVQLKAETYVDADVLERLQLSELAEVPVKIPNTFAWQAWGQRWLFVVGVVVTLGGVLLKRSRPDAEELEEGRQQVARLGTLLSELEGEVERLVQHSDALDADALHAAVDPLLLGPVYEIAEGRETIRQSHGQRVFTSVMDGFARGERNLNRAWSAAVDGHAPESRRSLATALPALREAREALPGAMPPGPRGFDTLDSGAPLPPDVPLAGGDDPWSSSEA